MTAAAVAPMTEDEVLGLFRTCSNVGRWGPEDALGTLNHISPAARLAALALPRAGIAVSLGHDLRTRGSRQVPPSAVHVMTSLGPVEPSAQDIVLLSPHGFETTHVDALGHMFFEGRGWNGAQVSGTVGMDGLRSGSIEGFRDGIVARGVLLDVAASRGVEHLAPGDGISAADLRAAERRAGVDVRTGDVVVVRSGLGLRVSRGGEDTPELREGILPDALPWLFEHEVAAYAGDCIERLPSGYPRVPMPLHQVGSVAMGLCLIDCPDVEVLAAACRRFGTAEFLLLVAPLRLPGGTASAVNPLAVF